MPSLPGTARDRQREDRTYRRDDAIHLSELPLGAAGKSGQDKPDEARQTGSDVVAQEVSRQHAALG